MISINKYAILYGRCIHVRMCVFLVGLHHVFVTYRQLVAIVVYLLLCNCYCVSVICYNVRH